MRRRRMDNVKRRLKGMQERLNKDLLGVETRTGLRLAMGLGDEGVPAISLFAMPTMMDYAKAVGQIACCNSGLCALLG